ncbi:hypothetical protein U1Q18_013486 [Sarracenia purpurea var. burkii]
MQPTELEPPWWCRANYPGLQITSDIEAIEVSSRDPRVNNSSMEPSFVLGNHVDGKVVSLNEHARLNNSGFASRSSDGFQINNASACQEGAVSEVLEQSESKTTKTGVQAMIENSSCLKSRETDPCSQNVGNSSARLKEPKNLMPMLLSLGSIVLQRNSAGCSALDNSRNLGLVNARDHHDSNFEGREKQNTVVACKEVLLNLETTAETLYNLFSKLRTLGNTEEVSGGSVAQLYSEATEMLPSIAKKILEVAKLVQSSNILGGKTEVGVSNLEPLLETFAESVSQGVIEILNRNCNTP